MTTKKSFLLILVVLLIIAPLSGCTDKNKDNVTTEEPVLNVKNNSQVFLQQLETKSVTLREVGNNSAETLNSLTSYGITRIISLRHPKTKTSGWEYDFASVKGCQKFTEKLIANPEREIGIFGTVTGKVVLLGSIPAYQFSNDVSWHYVVPIGSTVVLLSGNDLSTLYADSYRICEAIQQKLGTNETIISVDDINKQIYPSSNTQNTQNVFDKVASASTNTTENIPNSFIGSFT